MAWPAVPFVVRLIEPVTFSSPRSMVRSAVSVVKEPSPVTTISALPVSLTSPVEVMASNLASGLSNVPLNTTLPPRIDSAYVSEERSAVPMLTFPVPPPTPMVTVPVESSLSVSSVAVRLKSAAVSVLRPIVSAAPSGRSAISPAPALIAWVRVRSAAVMLIVPLSADVSTPSIPATEPISRALPW